MIICSKLFRLVLLVAVGMIFGVTAVCASSDGRILLSRPLRSAEHFECRLIASVDTKLTMSVPGEPRREVSRKQETAAAEGMLAILKVDSGRVKEAAFLFKAFKGIISGGNVGLSLPCKLIKIKLHEDSVAYTLPGGTLSSNEIGLFNLLFRFAGEEHILPESLSGELLPGKIWTLDVKLLTTVLNRQGIICGELAGNIVLVGKEKCHGTTCWKLKISVTGRKGKTGNGDFTYQAEMMLPVSEKIATPLKCTVKVRIKVVKALPEDNPLSAGMVLEREVVSDFSSDIIPQ